MPGPVTRPGGIRCSATSERPSWSTACNTTFRGSVAPRCQVACFDRPSWTAGCAASLLDIQLERSFELGTGLNTRFDRLHNGTIQWFDLARPDTIARRRRFFADRSRCTMSEGSVLDTDWFDTVAAAPDPFLF